MPKEKWKTFRVIHHNPIVLVHGFDFAEVARGKEGKNPANWNNTVKVVKETFGYIPLYDSYNKDTDKPINKDNPNSYADLFVVDNLDTSRYVAFNAEEMIKYMSGEVRPRLSYEVVVDLIGHSMGGLISRAYVQQVYSTFRFSRGRETAVLVAINGKVGVQRVVTIGTPHSGAALAEAWVHSIFAAIKRVEAVEDLSFTGAAKLNKVYLPHPGVQYILLPVRASYLALPSEFEEIGLYLIDIINVRLIPLYPDLIPQPSDGVVHIWSANWLYNEVIPITLRPFLRNHVPGPITPNVIRDENPINMGFDKGAHFKVIHAEDKIIGKIS
jgi:pimeloyl-ACP methyl ester carboxylesterase